MGSKPPTVPFPCSTYVLREHEHCECVLLMYSNIQHFITGDYGVAMFPVASVCL